MDKPPVFCEKRSNEETYRQYLETIEKDMSNLPATLQMVNRLKITYFRF